ncbi:MAG: serine/threonine-protein phosphatase [Actinomycetota bacterium]|nr:serine/threonine-protein phosphatase [Actinomycetota bacterium]
MADAVGKGPRAAALSALAIGVYRAGRRRGRSLQEVAAGIAGIVGQVGEDSAYITAVLGRWHAPDRTFSWVRCGHPLPAVWKVGGALEQLDDVGGLPLGVGRCEESYQVGPASPRRSWEPRGTTCADDATVLVLAPDQLPMDQRLRR